MSRAGKDFINAFLSRTSIVSAILVIGIICVTASIFGVNITLPGHKLISLSTTTAQVFNRGIISAKGNLEDSIVERLLADDISTDETIIFNKWKTVPMEVTAYCACRRCCGNFSDGITASGHKIRRWDAFAAADKRYRFGTDFIVPGYNNNKPIKVMDRGRIIRGNRIDVYFRSHRQAKRWGIKHLNVKVRSGG